MRLCGPLDEVLSRRLKPLGRYLPHSLTRTSLITWLFYQLLSSAELSLFCRMQNVINTTPTGGWWEGLSSSILFFKEPINSVYAVQLTHKRSEPSDHSSSPQWLSFFTLIYRSLLPLCFAHISALSSNAVTFLITLVSDSTRTSHHFFLCHQNKKVGIVCFFQPQMHKVLISITTISRYRDVT